LLATEETRKAVVTSLVSEVAGAYFNLLELDMELEIAKRTLAAREDSLELIRIREQGGVATLLEVRQGEQLVYTAAQAIPYREQLIEQTENQISLLLGKNPGAPPRGRPLTEQEHPPAVPPGLPSTLLERQPGHPGRRTGFGCRQRYHWRGQGGVFPADHLDELCGRPKQSTGRPVGSVQPHLELYPQITQPIFMAGD
jgi:multidrug efflux system outer membrane protein